jgi:hypothetical protein
MVNSRDEQIDPMSPTTKLKPPPKKQMKGNRHDANKHILKYFNQFYQPNKVYIYPRMYLQVSVPGTSYQP